MVSVSVSKRRSQVDCMGKFLKLYSMLKVPFKDVKFGVPFIVITGNILRGKPISGKEKIKLNFYFHNSLWCLKKFF